MPPACFCFTYFSNRFHLHDLAAPDYDPLIYSFHIAGTEGGITMPVSLVEIRASLSFARAGFELSIL
jgi:hypothetical protein